MAITGSCARCGRHANLDRKSRCASCRKELAKARAAQLQKVALALLGLGGLNAALQLLGQPKAPTGEVGMHQRVGQVRAAVCELHAKEGRLPKGLAELAQVAEEMGLSVPLMLPGQARPVPNAVLVRWEGAQLILTPTTETGQVLKASGAQVAIRVP